MPYVKRDSSNNIVGIFNNPNDKATEYVEDAVIYKSVTDIFEEARREEYEKEGVTIKAMVVALWENDQTVIAEMEAKRQVVKARIPKV